MGDPPCKLQTAHPTLPDRNYGSPVPSHWPEGVRPRSQTPGFFAPSEETLFQLRSDCFSRTRATPISGSPPPPHNVPSPPLGQPQDCRPPPVRPHPCCLFFFLFASSHPTSFTSEPAPPSIPTPYQGPAMLPQSRPAAQLLKSPQQTLRRGRTFRPPSCRGAGRVGPGPRESPRTRRGASSGAGPGAGPRAEDLLMEGASGNFLLAGFRALAGKTEGGVGKRAQQRERGKG